jgi:hypothetical protein
MASASKSQIKANRENAKRSTGPTSTQGKLKVSQNAITHGIFARNPLLPHEDVNEYQALKEEIMKTYPAVDAVAAGLCDRIILAFWRQHRLKMAEAAKLRISMTPELMAMEIADMMKLPSAKSLTAETISEEHEQIYLYWHQRLVEFENINISAVPENLTQVSTKFPDIYALLKEKAKESELSYDVFKKSPQEIIKTLEGLKTFAENYVKNNAIYHTAYNIAEQLKIAKLVPEGADVSFLNKYQVQLDADLRRAFENYKKHIEWRREMRALIEVEVVDELIEN